MRNLWKQTVCEKSGSWPGGRDGRCGSRAPTEGGYVGGGAEGRSSRGAGRASAVASADRAGGVAGLGGGGPKQGLRTRTRGPALGREDSPSEGVFAGLPARSGLTQREPD